uniref:NADH-ubiquinone oxidoreductase chain 4 n=1 Tax=Patella vulgata TaxID=6465 RepID=A0A481MVK9_PATVU|nr:NADH dehydrogenase subunit 4 [Patella vulgata]
MLINLLMFTFNRNLSWTLRTWTFGVGSFMSLFILFFHFNSFTATNYIFSLTVLGAALTSLTWWISFLMMLASTYSVKLNKNEDFQFSTIVSSLNLILTLAFSVASMLLFYIFFEASLIPTLLLILGWGYQPERLQAGMYMMMYTITASLPFLVILLTYKQSFNKLIILNNLWSGATMTIFFATLAFMVKLPIYSFHLWLPKAHVEAPIAGSMVLAAILLKLGGFGLIQTMLFFKFMNSPFNCFFISMSMWGGMITSFICLRQTDLKALIAYSSVGHMSLVFSGLLTYSSWGWNAAFMMMISHGLTSSGLFCLANMIYETAGSRSLLVLRGLSLTPSLTMWWFIFSMTNIPTPPTISLIAEILVYPALLHFSYWLFPVLMVSGMLSATYNLLMYSATQHGPLSQGTLPYNKTKLNHFILLFHFLPLLLLTASMSKLIF